jgi:hypothetical protein
LASCPCSNMSSPMRRGCREVYEKSPGNRQLRVV